MLLRIILILLLLLAFFIWLRMRAASGRARQSSPQASLSMRACSHCGVHVPENEVLLDEGGRFYCCARHLAQSRERD